MPFSGCSPPNLGVSRGGSTASHHSMCAGSLVASPSLTVGCTVHHGTAHTLHEVLFTVSITILLIFAVELIALLGILRVNFFRHVLYVVDFVGLAAKPSPTYHKPSPGYVPSRCLRPGQVRSQAVMTLPAKCLPRSSSSPLSSWSSL